MKKAFSLVEILVALIVVSLIMAALAPVITKKLSSAGITIIGGGSQESTETQWGEPRNQADCNPYNALYIPKIMNGGAKSICATKYNAGDANGADIPSTVTTVTTAGTYCNSGNCCWKGTTANPSLCTTNDGGYGSNYNGCTRTVCNYPASVAICSSWAPKTKGLEVKTWRLATRSEAQGWVDNQDTLNHKQGINGLQLCSGGMIGGGFTSVEGNVQCSPANGTGYKYCHGAYGDDSSGGYHSCYAHDYWLDGSAQLNFAGRSTFHVVQEQANSHHAFSTRCVTDNIPYPETIGGGSDGSSGSIYKNDCADIDACALCTSDKCVVCKNTYDLQDDGTCKKEDALDVNSLVNHPYTTSCSSFTDCALCSSSACVVCDDGHILSSGNCIDDPNLPIWNSTTCTDMHSKCVACTSEKCLACSKGYHVNKNGTCTADTHTVVTTCTNVDANCILCNKNTAGETCYACSSGYILNGGTCIQALRTGQPEKQADCDPYNAIFIEKAYNGTTNVNLCVTRYDVGMPGGPPIYYAGPGHPYSSDIRSVGDTSATSCINAAGLCAWTGQTSKSSAFDMAHVRGHGNYRPVMGYNAAHHSCAFWSPFGATHLKWQLPSKAMVEGWKSAMTNKAAFREKFFTDPYGANFCTTNLVSGDIVVQCAARNTSCVGAYDNGTGTGALNDCWPSRHWIFDAGGSDHYYYEMKTEKQMDIQLVDNLNWAFAGRCVSYDVIIR